MCHTRTKDDAQHGHWALNNSSGRTALLYGLSFDVASVVQRSFYSLGRMTSARNVCWWTGVLVVFMMPHANRLFPAILPLASGHKSMRYQGPSTTGDGGNPAAFGTGCVSCCFIGDCIWSLWFACETVHFAQRPLHTQCARTHTHTHIHPPPPTPTPPPPTHSHTLSHTH